MKVAISTHSLRNLLSKTILQSQIEVAISTHSLRNLSSKTMVCKPVSKTLSLKFTLDSS